MRRTLLIALVIVHSFGNTELSQLFRMPTLVRHYFEHARLNRDLGFLEFLGMHYGGDDGTHADDNRDTQLPCHNPQHNTLSVVCCKIEMDAPVSGFITTYYTTLYEKPLLSFLPQKHTLSPLQPPRTA